MVCDATLLIFGLARSMLLSGSMRLRPGRLLLSAFLLTISFANELNAQTTTSGGLTGVVSDPSQRPC